MNAVSLYLSTCRYVMQARSESPSSWSDLYKYLPYLRQALACCVCTKIVQIPIAPTDSICQHHICQSCRGGKMRLRPSCSWCKDHSQYQENTQLRIIVQCYKQLCMFLSSMNLSSTLSDVENGDKSSLLKIIAEGAEITDTFSYNANPLSMSMLSLTPLKTGQDLEVPSSAVSPVLVSESSPTKKSKRSRRRTSSSSAPFSPLPVTHVKKHDRVTQTDIIPPLITDPTLDYHHKDDLDDTNIEELRLRSAHLRSRDDTGENAPRSSKSVPKVPHLGEHDYMKAGPLCYSVIMPNGNEPKLTIRRRPTIQVQVSKKKPKLEVMSTTPVPITGLSIPKSRKQKTKDGKRKGCRCGMATPTPGKLTCCGQRCPCYTAWKPCVDCICRGCHNPRKELPTSLDGAGVVAEEVEISVV